MGSIKMGEVSEVTRKEGTQDLPLTADRRDKHTVREGRGLLDITYPNRAAGGCSSSPDRTQESRIISIGDVSGIDTCQSMPFASAVAYITIVTTWTRGTLTDGISSNANAKTPLSPRARNIRSAPNLSVRNRSALAWLPRRRGPDTPGRRGSPVRRGQGRSPLPGPKGMRPSLGIRLFPLRLLRTRTPIRITFWLYRLSPIVVAGMNHGVPVSEFRSDEVFGDWPEAHTVLVSSSGSLSSGNTPPHSMT
ncbi:hypothetical protein CPLU01_05969 [Colletotrichum plurivorum]|uniref:Uncharacterized protein n=1 Tax=Colletotrichum plurivorum TaxID=2175906 RepID=A0A8H6KK03_9PEZI|nr:hypothetical protein CPLU01_05969 [Colletotrichum plurivorum]